MHSRILWASVLIREETPLTELRFGPKSNILWGENADDMVLTLAGIFGGKPIKDGEAKICWPTGETLHVAFQDGACGIERIDPQCANAVQLAKSFHKSRFLNFGKDTHILDGAKLPDGCFSAGDRLLEKARDILSQRDHRPLFVCNFLERLDEAIDRQAIFEEFFATGRQIFFAVPNCYIVDIREGKYHGTTIHIL